MKYQLSVCIPAYNSSATIIKLIGAIHEALQGLEFEIIIVNDGSKDNTELLCLDLAQKYVNLKFYSLRKNFGENNAVMCALRHAEGQFSVIIDDDLQNPPAEIRKLYTEIQKGYDVVFSSFTQKNHGVFRNALSWLNNLLLTYFLDKPYGLYFSTFNIVTSEIVQEIIKYKGPSPYIQGLILRSTNNYGQVKVEHHSRSDGKSNYSIRKLVKLWFDILINFSTKPLRLVTSFGGLMLVLSITLFVSKEWILPWYTSVIMILFSLQLIALGIVGEYLSRLFLDSNGTPQYVLKKTRHKI